MSNEETPLLKDVYEERTEFQASIGLDWITASQIKNKEGEILERTFSQLSFDNEQELKLVNGSPPGHPDSYSFHYKTVRVMRENTFTGYKELDPLSYTQEEDEQLGSFKGWKYLVNKFYRTEFIADDLTHYIVWNLNSKPTSFGQALDTITIYNAADQVISQVSKPAPTDQTPPTLRISMGSCYGVRTQATNNLYTFNLTTSTNTTIKQFTRSSGLEVGKDTLKGISPNLVTHSYFTIARLPFVRPFITDPITLLPVITVVEQVKIFLYGVHWSQDFEYANSYEQGWLQHEPSTNLTGRLKPPGGQHLNDTMNPPTRVQPNVSPTDITTAIAIL